MSPSHIVKYANVKISMHFLCKNSTLYFFKRSNWNLIFDLLIAHSQREKQMLLAMLFSTSKYEKSKANVKLAKAKVEVLTLLLHSHWEVEHVPLMLCYKLQKLFSKWFSAIFTADLGLKWLVLVLNANWSILLV